MHDVTLVILNSLRIKCHIRRPLTLIARRRYVSMRCLSWPAAICISIEWYNSH